MLVVGALLLGSACYEQRAPGEPVRSPPRGDAGATRADAAPRVTGDASAADAAAADAGQETGNEPPSTGAPDASALPDGCPFIVREVCNGRDDDCDGATDEGSPTELRCDPGEVCVGVCF
jgi:hypothetical protein